MPVRRWPAAESNPAAPMPCSACRPGLGSNRSNLGRTAGLEQVDHALRSRGESAASRASRDALEAAPRSAASRVATARRCRALSTLTARRSAWRVRSRFDSCQSLAYSRVMVSSRLSSMLATAVKAASFRWLRSAASRSMLAGREVPLRVLRIRSRTGRDTGASCRGERPLRRRSTGSRAVARRNP